MTAKQKKIRRTESAKKNTYMDTTKFTSSGANRKCHMTDTKTGGKKTVEYRPKYVDRKTPNA